MDYINTYLMLFLNPFMIALGVLTLCLWTISEILIRHFKLKIICFFQNSGTIIPTILISFVMIGIFPLVMLYLPVRFLKILDRIHRLF